MFYQKVIHSRVKFTIIMTAHVVGTLTLRNSKPFQMRGFMPGAFTDRSTVVMTHIRYFVGH